MVAPDSATLALTSATIMSAPIIPASRRDGMPPSDSPIAQKTSTEAVNELANTAANVAPQTSGPIGAGAGASAWRVIVASVAVSANWARLNASRVNPCPRVNSRTISGPTTVATIRSLGLASSRPSTSGTSDSDSECALPRTCAWITNASATAKPAASAHHGIETAASYGTRSRTTLNHSTIAAMDVAAISAARDARVSRPSRSTSLQTNGGPTNGDRTNADRSTAP